MAAPTNTLITTSVVGIREDLSDFISLVDQKETPFMTRVAGEAKATNTYHEWLLDSLGAVDTSNFQAEGDDFAGTAIAQPTRVGNRTQILTKNMVISRTTETVNKAGRKKEMARVLDKKMTELARDIENFLLSNQASTAGPPRKLGGMESWITSNDNRGALGTDGGFSSSNTVAATDGTQRAFTETLLINTLKTAADNGAFPTVMLTGSFNRLAVNTFAGNATATRDTKNKTVGGVVEMYANTFGDDIKVMFSPQSRTRTVLLVDPDYVNVAYLDRPFKKPIADTGDSTKYMLITELTLEVKNEKACAVIADLTTS